MYGNEQLLWTRRMISTILVEIGGPKQSSYLNQCMKKIYLKLGAEKQVEYTCMCRLFAPLQRLKFIQS